jgi:hypothetical protein
MEADAVARGGDHPSGHMVASERAGECERECEQLFALLRREIGKADWIF